jgi:hypothetical protein
LLARLLLKHFAKNGPESNVMKCTSSLRPSAVYALGSFIIISGAAFIFGAFQEPQRLWADLLVCSFGLLGFGLGAAVFLALLFVTGAHWSDHIRPVAEKLTRLLPAGAVGVALVLLARPSLYPWTDSANESGSLFQVIWLSRPFFLLRAFLYLALWCGMTFLLVQTSRRQDTKSPGQADNSSGGIAAIFLVVFALTGWLASVDWIMSLEPKWTSTVFGIYNFAGMFLSALAAFIVLVIWFNRFGNLDERLSPGNLRDLGTLLFSFSSFWMYIWFSQYMLIWYVNIPEETDYFVLRQQNAWQPLFIANLVLNWGIPFLVLLFRPAKECPTVLLMVAVLVLVGRLVDIYLMVLPAVLAPGKEFVIWDACLLPGMLGLAALILALKTSAEAGSLKQV